MADIDKLESSCVVPPRVAESEAAMECEVHQVMNLGTGPGGANLVIGRIVCIHAADHLLDDNGKFEPSRLHTIGRMDGPGYVRTRDRFSIPRPGKR